MVNPAEDFAEKLEALGPYGLVQLVRGGNRGPKAANLFVGPVHVVRREAPSPAVFVLSQAGAAPLPYLGQDEDFQKFLLEVTVRSAPAKFEEGDELVRTIMDKAQRQAPTGYVACLLQSGGTEYLGEDDERQHLWRFFVELWWRG